MGEDAGTRVSDLDMPMRGLQPFNNKYLKVSKSQIDASMLELAVVKARWYLNISPLHIDISSVVIGYLVLMC